MTLYGLSDNKEQTIVLSPIDAFGVKDDNKTKYVSKDLFPNQEMVKVGNIIELDIKENDGEEATSFAMIKEIKSNQVLLDLNHPLAGIEIKFKVKIIKVYE